jgi:hypothetical protein
MLENPKFRLLNANELHKLKKFYKSAHATGLNPKSLVTAAVAELPDETIVGFLGFDFVPHAGPIEILEPYRHQGLGFQLYQTIEAALSKQPHTGYYTFPSTDGSKALAKKLGLVKLDWEIWKREY